MPGRVQWILTMKKLGTIWENKAVQKVQSQIFGVFFYSWQLRKNTEKWAAGNFLGPSYFEATIVGITVKNLQEIGTWGGKNWKKKNCLKYSF